MTQGKRKTWVIGHKNPDTDSICAAIAYADLKILNIVERRASAVTFPLNGHGS